jgi:hypothetical protein
MKYSQHLVLCEGRLVRVGREKERKKERNRERERERGTDRHIVLQLGLAIPLSCKKYSPSSHFVAVFN